MEDELNILLDVDGVLANFDDLCSRIVEIEFGIKIVQRPGIWDCFEFPEIKPYKKQITEFMINTPGIIRNMEWYDYAHEMVEALRKKGDVIACTDSVYPGVFTTERIMWLMDEFGFNRENIILSGKKYLIDGWMLIDDKPSNVEKWLQHHPDGVGVLWHPINRKYKLEIEDRSIAHKVINTSNYKDIIPYL